MAHDPDTPLPPLRYAEGGVTAARGFTAAGVAAGLKKTGRPDVMLLFSEQPASAAAVFTTNQVAAAPVVVSRASVADGIVRAAVANAGNANACTGAQGMADARAMAEEAGRRLHVPAGEVLVASTGVIGVPLPITRVLAGIGEAAERLEGTPADSAAEAIMTTDTFPKQAAVTFESQGRRYTMGGMAKGSGMIRPDMATMLAFVTTDAPLTAEACRAALAGATRTSFNRITVDGETSTNDTCLLMANGAGGGSPIGPGGGAFEAVAHALAHVCGELARMIVRDGEGATKFITVVVRGALTDADAETAAMAVAGSVLFKIALFGGDANWGRAASAAGASKATVDPDLIEVSFGGVVTCREGTAVAFDEEAAAAALAEEDVEVVVDLHLGACEATVWTCDLTYDYVRINADYRS
jgi:glutamate N-acetyltransferase/amino-acid N-acetyltransferase